MQVIDERVRRNCQSALTRYYVRAKEKTLKVKKENGLLDLCLIKSDKGNSTPNNYRLNTKSNKYTLINDKVPLFKQEDCYKNYIKNIEYNCVPLKMVLLETPNKKLPNIKEEKLEENNKEKGFSLKEPPKKWLGIEDIIESYRVYSKGIFQKRGNHEYLPLQIF